MSDSSRHGVTRLSAIVLMPVYEDWESAAVLCRALDESASRVPHMDIRILLVDDGSPSGLRGWESFTPDSVKRIEVLRLRRNLGHQRAIAVGLVHIHLSRSLCDTVLVMDADGEDRPEDAIRLLGLASERPLRIIFAQRRKRLEDLAFRLGYRFYRGLHLCLTGIPVSVGNFSVVPFSCLKRLVCMHELWNHYAGAVFRSKIPFDQVPMDRGLRYRGKSHMNLIALVNHGLAGIASFQDIAATRILIANAMCLAAVVVALASVVAVRFFTGLAIPGWATYSAGLLLVLLLQLLAVSFNLVFVLMSGRMVSPVLPERDCPALVDCLESL